MRIRKSIAAAAGTAGAVLSLALPATAATASQPRMPVVAWQADGWSAMMARPGSFYLGEGGAPYFTHLRWHAWLEQGSYATGRLWIMEVGCLDQSQCQYRSRAASLYLHDVQVHDGVRYFAQMTVRTYEGRQRIARYLTFAPAAPGTLPYWQGMLTWPYLAATG
jgi:hypothetical protein